MHLAAWNKTADIVIMITISLNTRGFGAYLTKYAPNEGTQYHRGHTIAENYCR